MQKQDFRRKKVKTIFAAAVNGLIVILTIYGMSRFFTVGGDGNMPVMNTSCFRFFTVDSNLLAAIGSLLMLIGQLRQLGKDEPLPAAFLVLKHVGSTAVGVTFFTVFCFLGMLYGYASMIAGVNLYMHLITPLLAMLGFILLEKQPPIRFRSISLGLLPTLLYGVVYVYLVVIRKRWPDFYGFNIGGHWILSCCLMVLATFLISLGLWALRRAGAGKRAGMTQSV